MLITSLRNECKQKAELEIERATVSTVVRLDTALTCEEYLSSAVSYLPTINNTFFCFVYNTHTCFAVSILFL